MKINLISFFILIQSWVWSQDTLFVDSKNEASSYIYSELDPNLYNFRLLDRAFSTSQIIADQVNANYNHIHDLNSWMEIYSDLTLSYADTSKIQSIEQMGVNITNFFYFVDMELDDELIQPFSLALHNMNYIDSLKYVDGSLIVDNNKLVSTVAENTLYRSAIIKSAAVLEFYPDNGYTLGYLYYDETFISTSDDIEIISTQIDVGNGFIEFSQANPIIEYSRELDSSIAKVAVTYLLKGRTVRDTLQFYLTTKSNLSESDFDRSVENWDHKYTRVGLYGINYRLGFKYGCGNDNKIRRPIIFVSPYRPSVQIKSMLKFWKQFNFKSLFLHLSDMGYDVIFINEKPGNASIEKGGDELASFITEINLEKQNNFPGEYWENVLVGFSAGGQHARYALMKLEKDHMENGGAHHHTRLYIPFDSPHLGGNVPMFSQIIYKDLSDEALSAMMPWLSLKDDASTDMLYYHIEESPIDESTWPYRDITPIPHSNRDALMVHFNNYFIHELTPMSDLRKTYPTFSRNVAISTGSFSDTYFDDYGLSSGELLYEVESFTYQSFPPGISVQDRSFYSSSFLSGTPQNLFIRNDQMQILFLVPVFVTKTYRTIDAYEFDNAQGGYKTEFFEGLLTSSVFILNQDANTQGTQHYTEEVMFMPLVSALGINPTSWANNNLYYNLQDSGLMYQTWQAVIDDDKSDIYGYPHLFFPINHFQITPFEAVFADPFTYDHIKMQESVDEYDLDDTYLVSLRNFICDEVEGLSVFLQNKVVGNNHVQTNPNYVYHAWYKARNEIVIGRQVTPKTDVGDYIIESTGDITVYAGNAVIILPGFHAQAGSEFHAYIDISDCDANYGGRSAEGGQDANENEKVLIHATPKEQTEVESNQNQITIYPNPNDGSFLFQTNFDLNNATISIFNLTGQQVFTSLITSASTRLELELEKGVYLVIYQNGETRETIKMVIQ